MPEIYERGEVKEAIRKMGQGKLIREHVTPIL